MEYKFNPATDYYAILGLSPQAEESVIKAAYRALSQKYHPDKNEGDSLRMQEINEAYSVLSSKDSRNAYDNSRNGVNSGKRVSPSPPHKKSPCKFNYLQGLFASCYRIATELLPCVLCEKIGPAGLELLGQGIHDPAHLRICRPAGAQGKDMLPFLKVRVDDQFGLGAVGQHEAGLLRRPLLLSQ